MNKLTILAAVVALAASGANCANSGRDISSSSNILAPSSDAAVVAAGRSGGGGGGKGKPVSGDTSGSSSLTLAMVTDANANGLPNWGDTVTFNISTTATTQPNVSLTCSQNGVVVYGASAGFYASYPWPWTQNMTLSSNDWQGGAADCIAKLYYFSGTNTIDLKSISVSVAE